MLLFSLTLLVLGSAVCARPLSAPRPQAADWEPWAQTPVPLPACCTARCCTAYPRPACCGPAPAPPPPAPALPALNIDPAAITVSGISSGADFVVNLHVAHSKTISGVGVFAGQAYHCSVTRFPKDALVPLNPGVPVCDGCPKNATLGYDHCKQHPEYVDVDLLVDYAARQSALGAIDNVSNIQAHQLYFYRGTHDTCYKTGAEEATLGFYSRLTLDRGNGNRVAYRGDVGSDHAQPTGPRYPGEAEWGGPCGGKGGGKGKGPWSYIEACGYDGAGGVLKHMYGDSLEQPAGPAKPENLLVFDQSAFWVNATHPELKSPNLPADGSGGTAAFAYAYVPARCRKPAHKAAAGGQPPPQGAGCRLHLYHHGCGGPWGSDFYNGVAHHGGFNEWAEANELVVVYPAMSSWGATGQTRGGCWDGYAQTGSDYGLKSGAQISVVHNMIARLAGL